MGDLEGNYVPMVRPLPVGPQIKTYKIEIEGHKLEVRYQDCLFGKDISILDVVEIDNKDNEESLMYSRNKPVTLVSQAITAVKNSLSGIIPMSAEFQSV